mgnify:CR=1 FL=1
MDTLNLRIFQTHDTEENWNKCLTFIPRAGEVIVYDIDANVKYERFKIGDGVTPICDLPFTVESMVAKMFNIQNNVIYADGGLIRDYKGLDKTSTDALLN